MPESTRRSEPGALAERLTEAFLADFWAAQPRGEATVRVGDEDLVLVYRSTPDVQRQLDRLDGVRLLAPGTLAAVVRFLVEAVALPDTPRTAEAPWALPAGDLYGLPSSCPPPVSSHRAPVQDDALPPRAARSGLRATTARHGACRGQERAAGLRERVFKGLALGMPTGAVTAAGAAAHDPPPGAALPALAAARRRHR